ncbi:hypothetical protein Tco_1519629 [Tanacetum coccineum]
MSPGTVTGNKVYDKVDLPRPSDTRVKGRSNRRSSRRIIRSSRHTAVAADTQSKRTILILYISTTHIDGQSTEVDAPLDIIDVVDQDDITDDEDTLPHDLADFDDEDLINVDDDGVDKVYSSEEEY